MIASASSTFALQASERNRAKARREALDQWPKMSEAMIEEEGLLNYAQAALLLNVSVKRINELVRHRTLIPFEQRGGNVHSLKLFVTNHAFGHAIRRQRNHSLLSPSVYRTA